MYYHSKPGTLRPEVDTPVAAEVQELDQPAGAREGHAVLGEGREHGALEEAVRNVPRQPRQRRATCQLLRVWIKGYYTGCAACQPMLMFMN